MDKVAHLLLTLPPSYDGVITAIETLSENTLTLAFVKTRLLDHQVKIRTESADTSKKVLHVESVVNTTKGSSFNTWKIKGFGHKFGQFNKYKNNRRILGIRCHHCNKPGHIKRECRYYLKELRKNQKEGEKKRTIQTIQMAQQLPSNENSGFAFMTGDYEKCEKEGEITFPMDSGASDHLINREDLTKDFVKLNPPIKVGVAKSGCFILATKIGSLNVKGNLGVLQHSLVLKDVLYSAEVPNNLLSISKLRKAKLRTVLDVDDISISRDGKTVATGQQLADALTKPLPTPKFTDFRLKMYLK